MSEVAGRDVVEALRQPQAVTGMLAREAERHGFDGWVGGRLCTPTSTPCAVLRVRGRLLPRPGLPPGRSRRGAKRRRRAGRSPGCNPMACAALAAVVQVLEGWSHWAAMGVTQHPELRQAALGLLRQVAAALAPGGRRLVLAVAPLVPAPGRPPQLAARDVEELLPLVDALSGKPA